MHPAQFRFLDSRESSSGCRAFPARANRGKGHFREVVESGAEDRDAPGLLPCQTPACDSAGQFPTLVRRLGSGVMGAARRGRAGIPAYPGETQAGGRGSGVSSCRRPHPHLARIAAGLVLSLGLFVYTATRVQPTLEWHRDQPQFYWTLDFFRLFWREPGGLVRYAAAALAQCDVHNWSGALVFTLLASGLGTLGCALLKRADAMALFPAAFTPPLLLLWLRQAFGASALSVGLGVFLAWALGLGLSRWTRTGSAGELGLSCLGAAGVYAVAGFWAWLSFLVAVEVFRSPTSRTWLRTVVFWLGSLAAAAGLAWSYDTALVPRTESLSPAKRQLLSGALALGVPALALIRSRVIPRLRSGENGPGKTGSISLPALSRADLRTAPGLGSLVATVLLAGAVAADYRSGGARCWRAPDGGGTRGPSAGTGKSRRSSTTSARGGDRPASVALPCRQVFG